MKDKYNMKQEAEKIAKELSESGKNSQEKALLLRELFDTLTDMLFHEKENATHISSPNALVEILDRNTGRLYRRYLELSCEETANGIRLIGEDIGGKPVQIVFLSNSAIEQMKDLQGSGANHPRCEH